MNPNCRDNLKPFQKGNKAAVGNGRPKGKSLTTLLQEALDAPLSFKVDGKKQTKTAAEWIATRAITRAVNGDFKYFKEIKDSLDGRPLQKIVQDTKVDIDLGTLTDEQLAAQIDRMMNYE